MGSIEGVIILSAANEPILHSHFLHPLPNYPTLHADQLAVKLEGAPLASDVLPLAFTEGIPHLPIDDGEEGEEDGDSKGSEPEGETTGVRGSALVHIQHNQLRLVATFSKHVDPLLPLTFLHTLLSVLELYLGTPLTEESIRENFDIVYQLLEEMLDESGQPLNTEYNCLRDIVREPSWVQSVVGKMASVPGLGSSATPAHVSNIPWRRPLQAAQRSARNEIFVDVVETLQGSFTRGSHPRAMQNLSLRGSLECNSRLSGTPDLSLRFNDSKAMVAMRLHPCVRVKRWKKEGLFSFIPPDGRFVLADFDVDSGGRSWEKQVPVWIRCSREEKSSKDSSLFEIQVGATATVDQMEICFVVQEKGCTIDSTLIGGSRSGLQSEDVNALKGTVHHDAKSGLVKWSIDRLEATQKPIVLSGTIRSDAAPKLSSAVTCRFVVPLKSAAGLKVTSLEVVNETGYRPFKGVRNLLKGDLDWRW